MTAHHDAGPTLARRLTGVVLAGAAAIGLVACTATGSAAPSRTLPPTTTAQSPDRTDPTGRAASVSADPLWSSPQRLCAAAFPNIRLLAWGSGVVGQFRDYHYSGPRPIYPLAAVYPDLDVGTTGAWCGTQLRPDTIRWSVVVSGQPPVKALDITGPGATTPLGPVDHPPRVP